MRHAGTHTIETERLILRRFTLEDAPAVFDSYASDPNVAQFLRWNAHKNVEETLSYLTGVVNSYQDPCTYNWAVLRKEDNALIGSVSLFLSTEPDTTNCWEAGYCYGQAYWGHGYATEACKAAIAYFVESTGIYDIRAKHSINNPASGSVLSKSGFSYLTPSAVTRHDGTEVLALLYTYQPRE